jgi:ribosome-associated protein
VELTLDVHATDGLPQALDARVVEVLRLDREPHTLTSARDRSRERNRAAVLRELAHRVAPALRPPPQPRRPTRPTKASRDRRREHKRRRGATKRLRRGPSAED